MFLLNRLKECQFERDLLGNVYILFILLIGITTDDVVWDGSMIGIGVPSLIFIISRSSYLLLLVLLFFLSAVENSGCCSSYCTAANPLW